MPRDSGTNPYCVLADTTGWPWTKLADPIDWVDLQMDCRRKLFETDNMASFVEGLMTQAVADVMKVHSNLQAHDLPALPNHNLFSFCVLTGLENLTVTEQNKVTEYLTTPNEWDDLLPIFRFLEYYIMQIYTFDTFFVTGTQIASENTVKYPFLQCILFLCLQGYLHTLQETTHPIPGRNSPLQCNGDQKKFEDSIHTMQSAMINAIQTKPERGQNGNWMSHIESILRQTTV